MQAVHNVQTEQKRNRKFKPKIDVCCAGNHTAIQAERPGW